MLSYCLKFSKSSMFQVIVHSIFFSKDVPPTHIQMGRSTQFAFCCVFYLVGRLLTQTFFFFPKIHITSHYYFEMFLVLIKPMNANFSLQNRNVINKIRSKWQKKKQIQQNAALPLDSAVIFLQDSRIK